MKDFEESSLSEFALVEGENSLKLKKADTPAAAVAQIPAVGQVPSFGQIPAIAQIPAGAASNVQAAAVSASPAAAVNSTLSSTTAGAGISSGAQEEQAAGTPITAPLAGIFYRAPKPGEKPFVEVGSKVEKGETVGLIEAMKMISEIPAPCSGIVKSILADDAEFAEYGKALIVIDDAANA